MKRLLLLISILLFTLPVFEVGTLEVPVKLIPQYYKAYEAKGVVIYHARQVDTLRYIGEPLGCPKVYDDLVYYYNRKSDDYIKFNQYN